MFKLRAESIVIEGIGEELGLCNVEEGDRKVKNNCGVKGKRTSDHSPNSEVQQIRFH